MIMGMVQHQVPVLVDKLGQVTKFLYLYSDVEERSPDPLAVMIEVVQRSYYLVRFSGRGPSSKVTAN